MVISKSEYMMFLKHPAWLWLKKYDKSKIPIPDEELQARFDEGTLFEEYAEKLFPGAVKLGYKKDGVFSGNMYYSLPEQTKREIDKGTKTIFQGRLEVPLPEAGGSITSIFDVLERVDDPSTPLGISNTFDLYEIKSSTSAKPEHTPDLAFQTIVLETRGLKIRNMYVIHANNKYIRKGEIIPTEIASKTEVTEEVRGVIDETLENIKKAFDVLKQKQIPDISPKYVANGGLPEWLEILKLLKGDFERYSIYNLCRITPKKIDQLEEAGYKTIDEIPLDFDLAESQLRQVIATKTGERKVDHEEIKNFLDSFEFPLYFFDFETISSVIPIFDDTRPYQQVPFQYSLHIQEEPGGSLSHKEYLHTTNTDPIPHVLKQMNEDFGGKGSIISWNKKFEMKRNEEMAKIYPEFSKFLLNLNDRMVDLMEPFSKGWFVDKDFFGSASIKRVLPVLVPELSYKELEVSHGGMAQRVWMETMLKGKNIDSKDEIVGHLKKYCALDTYAMYAIYKYLVEAVSS